MKELDTSALALATHSTNVQQHWSKFAARRRTNTAQQRLIFRNAKTATNAKDLSTALKAAASLTFCNRRVIVEKKGNEYLQAGAWYCGKKYCAYCSNRKRRKILNRFIDFFKSEKGKDLLKNYDLALLTLTLKHNKKDTRTEPYYKELSTHFANGMKYGAFKKYISGGFYNTEHTYSTRNGHHIHRHALILVPRKFDILENFLTIQKELQTQWKKRTGGSFQIDLRPLGYDELTETTPSRTMVQKNINLHMLEVTKYITKRDETGTINYQIVKAVEENSRAKFYGRFGILHKVKELNLNLQELEGEAKEKRELYIGTAVIQTKKIIEKGKKTIRTKTKKIHCGVDQFTYKEKKGANFTRWEHQATKVTFKDLTPIEDTKEAFKIFADSTRTFLSSWKDEKWNKIRSGDMIEKFRTRNKVNNFTNFEICSENYSYHGQVFL